MSDQPQAVSMTPAQFQELMSTVLAKANQMNPLDARKYQEELDKESRRTAFKATIRAEVAAQTARLAGCSHSRWPANAGKLGGHACPSGQGEWTTGGQIHSHGLIGIACLRCGKGWLFKATPNELDYAENAGILGMAPPPPSRELKPCRHCSELHVAKDMTEHEAGCPKKLVKSA